MNNQDNYLKPVRILEATFEASAISIKGDFASFTIPFEEVTHLVVCNIVKKQPIEHLFIINKKTMDCFYLESSTFNYRKLLGKSLHKSEKNFIETLRRITEVTKVAFVDWPVKDLMQLGKSKSLPKFNDMARAISYCSDVITNNDFTPQKNLVENNEPDDSPSVIFHRNLEKFKAKRENSRSLMNKVREQVLQADKIQHNQTRKTELLQKSIAETDKIILSDPTCVQAYFLKYEIGMKMERKDIAADSIAAILDSYQDGSIKVYSSINLFMVYAELMHELGEFEKQKNILQIYYGLFPSKNFDKNNVNIVSGGLADSSCEWYLYYTYGYELYLQGEYANAVEMFNQSLSRFNLFRWSYHARGCCFKELGRKSQALDSFNSANSLSENMLTYMEIARLQEELGRYDLAQNFYRKIIEMRPHVSNPYIALASNLLNYAKDESLCFELMLKAIELDPYGDFVSDASEIVNNMSQRIVERHGKDLANRDDLKVGDVFDNRYKIKEIHKGGMGVVYIVRDNTTMNLYALKTFQDRFLWNESIRNMFNREAEVWIRLGAHNNIVQAIQLKTFDGKPYVFLEYIDGTDLDALLKSGQLYVEQIIDYAMQFCNGMAYAFRTLGIVHQDIKPSNCMLTKQGVLKITDFGLVKVFTDSQPTEVIQSLPSADMAASGVKTGFHLQRKVNKSSHSLVQSATTESTQNQIVGTLPYMAPEQFTGEWPVSTATDIYSFGTMLYEMLTGAPPFGKDDAEQCIIGHIERVPVEPIKLRPEIATSLNQLVMRCLKKDPTERYEDFAELLNELNKIYEELFQSSYNFELSVEPGVETLESLLYKGEAFMVLSKYKEAIVTLGEALKSYPTSIQLFCSLAECFRRIGRIDEAMAYLKHALKIDPENADVYYKLGLLYFSKKDLQRAHENFQSAAELNPNDAEVWLKLGAIFDIINNTDEALHKYDLALKVNPRNSIVWNNKGFIYQRTGKYSDAMECYIRAIEFNPRYHVAWFNQGTLQQILNLYEESIQSFKKVLQLNPSNAKASIGIAMAYQKLRDYDKAIKIFDDILAVEPNNPFVLSMKADCISLSANKELAVELLKRATKYAPDDLTIREHLAILLADIHCYSEALPLLSSMIKEAPNAVKLLEFTEEIKRKLEYQKYIEENLSFLFKSSATTISDFVVDLNQQIDAYKKNISMHGEQALLKIRLAVLEAFTNNNVFKRESKDIFEKYSKYLKFPMDVPQELLAIRQTLNSLISEHGVHIPLVDQKRLNRLEERGKSALLKGNYTAALGIFQQLISDSWQSVNVWYNSALAKLYMGHPDEVLPLSDQGLARNPLDVRFLLLKATCYLKLSNFQAAQPLFYQALAIDPLNRNAFVWICNLFTISGLENSRLEFANRYLPFYLSYYATSEEYDSFASLVYLLAGRPLEAKKVLKRAEDRHPTITNKIIDVYIDLTLKNYENLKSKLLSLKNGVATGRRELQISQLLLGYFYFIKKEYDQAADMLDNIPADSEFYNYAFYFRTLSLFESNTTAQNATYLIGDAISKIPSNYLMWDAQAILQARENMLSESLWSLEKALALNPSSLTYLLNKGVVLTRLKRPDEALKAFDDALALNPKNIHSLSMKAACLYHSERYDESISLCKKILSEIPAADYIHHCIALSLLKKGELEAAREAIDEALSYEPFRAQLWNTRGVIMRSLDMLPDEIFSYNRALNLDPTDPDAALNKALWLLEGKELEAAIEMLDVAIKDPRYQGIIWRERGFCQAQLGRHTEALRCYNSASDFFVDDIETYNGKAEVLVALDRQDDALFFIDKSLELDPAQPMIWNNRGVILAMRGNMDEALNSFMKAYNQDEIYDYVLYNILFLAICTNNSELKEVFGRRFTAMSTELIYPKMGDSSFIFTKYRKLPVPFALSSQKEIFELIVSDIPYFVNFS